MSDMMAFSARISIVENFSVVIILSVTEEYVLSQQRLMIVMINDFLDRGGKRMGLIFTMEFFFGCLAGEVGIPSWISSGKLKVSLDLLKVLNISENRRAAPR